MSRRTSKRVSFSPDVNEKPEIFVKQGGDTSGGGSRKRVNGLRSFRLNKDSKLLPVNKILRLLKSKMGIAMSIVGIRRESSRKVSSSNFTRSRSVSESIESHRAEAIEDCIEFLNFSSSLSRSNSVSGGSY